MAKKKATKKDKKSSKKNNSKKVETSEDKEEAEKSSDKTEAKRAPAKTEAKEEVCEVFEVEKKGAKGKKGKEKEVVACGDMPAEKKASKKDLAKQERILRYFFIVVGAIVLLVLGGVYYINTSTNFTYRGTEFQMIRQGEITAYETEFPYYNEDKEIVPYYIYIRNDPRKLDREINFNGEMDFGGIFPEGKKHRLYMQTEGNFYCDAYGVISEGNLHNLGALGIGFGKVTNATFDEQGRYMFLNVVEGDKTEINQIGDACYELTVNNCEILEGTERFMAEAFVYFNEHLEQ